LPNQVSSIASDRFRVTSHG